MRVAWVSAVPSSRGGVAAPLTKFREATEAGADGVVARGTTFSELVQPVAWLQLR